MTKVLLAWGAAPLLAVTLHAQPPTPATQPARPPDRPPSGEPATPLPAPEPDLGGSRDRGDDERAPRPRGTGDGGDDAEGSTLTLTGCLERVAPRGFRLRQVEGRDDTVADDVRLQGAAEQLRGMVGKVVEVRGTYEQATPATTDPYFSVDRVRQVQATCEAR